MKKASSGLYPALLKHWRRQRALSQLDFALAADVSSRHISFLETGRSKPSRDMVLHLARTLGVPLRHQNEMLKSAGFAGEFESPDIKQGLPESMQSAIDRLKKQQEPFPLVVMDRHYNVIDINQPGRLLLGALGERSLSELNIMSATFDPEGWQPYIQNYDEVGRELLWRLERECLAHPEDDGLSDLLAKILAYDTVSPAWRKVDLGRPSAPTLVVNLNRGGFNFSFFTMVTAFNAPQNVTVEELRIESYFPYDDATAALCKQLFVQLQA